MKVKHTSVLIWFLLILGTFGYGNNYSRISLSSDPNLDEKLNLEVSLDLENNSYFPIKNVNIFFRELSESHFNSQVMVSEGFRYLGNVNLAKYQGNVVEYFFDVEYADGSHQHYPEEAPDGGMLKTSVNQGFDSGEGIVVISPEINETIFTDEFLLTASFFQYSNHVDKARTKLFLNKWDVSRYVKVYNDFLTFAPKRVPPGKHEITLEMYDNSGRLITRKKWTFFAKLRKGPRSISERSFKIDGNFFAESRSEELVDGARTNQYNKTGLRLRGGTKSFEIGTRLYLSNQENELRQPVNRYTGWAQVNFWNNRFLRINGGDAYPRMSPFLMNNIFLRGVHGEMHLRFLNLEYASGYNRRGIENKTVTTIDTVANDTTTSTSPGTFERKLWAARGSFGNRDNFQWGFTVVKGKDEVNPIHSGGTPEETAAFGTDMYIATPDKKIIIEGSFNLSSYNPNILNGESIPLDSLKELGVEDITPDQYDFITSIITVNEYLIVLPGSAYHGAVRLNVLKNNLSVSYRSVQDRFRSLGQPFLLRDTRGVTISDNIRLFQNQLFLTLRYQKYENNLDDIKPGTTESQTASFNLSYFPLKNLPSLTFGYNNHTRNKSLDSTEAQTGFPEDNLTNTINFSSSYGFLTGPLKNRLTFNVLNYNRTDNTNFGVDNLSNTVSLNLQTQYSIPLKTHINFSFQQTNNTPSKTNTTNTSITKLNLNGIGGGVEYRFGKLFSQQDRLSLAVNGKLSLVGSEVELGTAPTTQTDYNRTYLNGRLIYNHALYGRISFNGDLIQYSGDRSFQDYILTARYDVNF